MAFRHINTMQLRSQMNTDLYWIMNTGHLTYDWIPIVLQNQNFTIQYANADHALKNWQVGCLEESSCIHWTMSI